jgi:hypothetical protein
VVRARFMLELRNQATSDSGQPHFHTADETGAGSCSCAALGMAPFENPPLPHAESEHAPVPVLAASPLMIGSKQTGGYSYVAAPAASRRLLLTSLALPKRKRCGAGCSRRRDASRFFGHRLRNVKAPGAVAAARDPVSDSDPGRDAPIMNPPAT